MSDELSGPYWAGAAENRFVVQRCDDCGTLRHYPRIMCSVCQSFRWSPFEAARTGTVYSWTISHHVFDATVTTEVPYTLVTVSMDDGVRVLGRISTDVELRPDLPVELSFVPDGQGRPGPTFRPVAR